MNIYQRLNAVRKAVAYIQKDKQVGSGGWGYKAVTHDAVTAAVREHLIEQGVMIVPSIVEHVVAQTGSVTGKGTPIIRFEAIFELRFVNVDDPQDFVAMRIPSHALDEGDKAPGKAVSYATKYAMLKLFSIETGEDDEDRVAAKVSKKVEADKGKVMPSAGAMEMLSQDEQEDVVKTAQAVEEHFDAERIRAALKLYNEFKERHAVAEIQAALRGMLSAKCKTALRREAELTEKARAELQKAGIEARPGPTAIPYAKFLDLLRTRKDWAVLDTDYEAHISNYPEEQQDELTAEYHRLRSALMTA